MSGPVRLASALILSCGLLALAPMPGDACIHPPAGFKGYVDSAAQRGLLFWDNGREELVLQPGYQVNTSDLDADEIAADGTLVNFKSFAWVVPLPALPDAYAEADKEIFKDLDKFTPIESRIPKPEKSDSEDDPAISYDGSEGVTFFEPLDVGDYKIQPIKAKGEDGGKALGDWLKNNGFGELDKRVLRFYLDHEYYWLAVKLAADKGLPAKGAAKPLHISFKTPAPTYPWKIYDKQGEFDLELWVITRDAIDLTKCRRFGIETAEQSDDTRRQKNRNPSYVQLPETVRAIADDVDDLKALRVAKVFVYRFFGHDIEAEDGFDLGTLQEDMTFAFEKDIAPKPKQEVKPTDPNAEKKDEKGEDEGKDADKDGGKPDK